MRISTLAPALLISWYLLARGSPAAQDRYRLEPITPGSRITERYSPNQLALLEKLNRADRAHLPRLSALVVPSSWELTEIEHSPLPSDYAPAALQATFLVVHLSSQSFGAYEFGRLVHWGPISSGAAATPTPSGLFHLTWRSPTSWSRPIDLPNSR